MTTPKFTFIEPETNEVPAGMFCDPVTGLCGPVLETNDEAEEKSEADE
ncbi:MULTISPECIES: hypothetical protein [unclassified Jeotgalibaca]